MQYIKKIQTQNICMCTSISIYIEINQLYGALNLPKPQTCKIDLNGCQIKIALLHFIESSSDILFSIFLFGNGVDYWI